MANDGAPDAGGMILPNMDVVKVSETIFTAQRGQYWPPLPKQWPIPGVISLVRFYSCGLSAAESVVNTSSALEVKFPLPAIVLAGCGSCRLSDGSGFPVGLKPNDTYDVELLAGAGSEKITISPRMASTVLGTAERPGFFGGGGWIFPSGSFMNVNVTPRLAGLAVGVTQIIDITFHVLEFRSGRSYVRPPGFNKQDE